MTVMQIASLAVAAAVAAYFYLPSWPTKKPSALRQIEAVLEIRDSNTNPEVREACLQLLQALLQ